jgi:hypothetical protein
VASHRGEHELRYLADGSDSAHRGRKHPDEPLASRSEATTAPRPVTGAVMPWCFGCSGRFMAAYVAVRLPTPHSKGREE